MQSAPALQEHATRFDEPVRSLLRTKGRVVWSIGPEDTVFRAIELMSEKQIGCQNRRRYSPPGVSGPTWVSSVSSSGALR